MGSLAALGDAPTDLDLSFPQLSTNTSRVNDLVLFPDGKIGFGGEGKGGSRGILNADGSVFSSGDYWPFPLNCVAVDSERTLLGGGSGNANAMLIRLVGRDPDVNFADTVLGAADSGEIRNLLITPDAGVLAAGQFIHSTNRSFGLLQLDRGGRLETAFDRSPSAGLSFITAALAADGSILGSYRFTNQNNALVYGFGRWSSTGARDAGFGTAWLQTLPPDSRVTVLTPNPASTGFLVAVESGQGADIRTSLFTLNAAGEFGGSLGVPEILGMVHTLAVFPPGNAVGSAADDNLLIVGGSFTAVGRDPVNNLAAFGVRGALAWSLPPGTGPDGPVRAVQVQLDGKVLVGGAFTNFNGAPRGPLVRLLGNNATSKTRLFWSDSEFRGFEKTGAALAMVKRSGRVSEELEVSVDLSFETASPADFGSRPTTIHFAAGETEQIVTFPVIKDFLVEGPETAMATISSTNLDVLITRPNTRLIILDDETPGTFDPSFQLPPGVSPTLMALQPDGRLLARERSAQGLPTLSRYLPNGAPDETFTATNTLKLINGSGTWPYFSQIKTIPGGKFYVGGGFATTNKWGVNCIARLNGDGSIDSTFNPMTYGVMGNGGILFDVQKDGKIVGLLNGLFGGSPPKYGMPLANFYPALIRLNEDGSLDPQFSYPDQEHPEQRALSGARQIIVLEDQRILVNAGVSNQFGVFAFTPEGKVDRSFSVLATRAGSGGNLINDMTVAGDSLVIVGRFTAINGVAAPQAARVRLTDGALDPNFGITSDGDLLSVKFSDGKIYLAGRFTRINGEDRFRFARLNADGSLDHSYNPGRGPIGAASFVVQPGGGVLLTSDLASVERVDNIPVPNLARLEGDPHAISLQISQTSDGLTISYPRGRLETSSDLVIWNPISTGGGAFLTPASNQKAFFRLVSP